MSFCPRSCWTLLTPLPSAGVRWRRIGGVLPAGATCSPRIDVYKRQIPVDLILFADTGAEHPHTYAYLEVMDRWLKDHGMPPITRVYKTCLLYTSPTI